MSMRKAWMDWVAKTRKKGNRGKDNNMTHREALKAAAASFPAGTALGVDHIPPRALLRLSEEALVALAKILTTMERN